MKKIDLDTGKLKELYETIRVMIEVDFAELYT